MGRFCCASWFLTVLWVLGAVPARAETSFRVGPVVLDQAPAKPGRELGNVLQEDALKGRWPAQLASRIREETGAGRQILLIGRTDNFGPRALNRSLGLQYAVETARQLSSTLRLDPSLFACASTGEEGRPEPGIGVFSWEGPSRRGAQSGRVTVLEPAGNNASAGRFWGFWERGGEPAVLGLRGPQGSFLWDLNPSVSLIRLPLPAYVNQAALGVWFPPGEALEARTDHPVLPADRTLILRSEALESWAVRLTGRVPAGYSDPVVWACGIPYPTHPGPDGRFTVDAALLGRGNRAYLQAVDKVGRAATGPGLALPDGEGAPPDLIAVLVWEGDTDLDLYAWSGPRRTDPQDPDFAFSPRAVEGARLLFDGDASRPASALFVRGVDALDLEAHCYSDLGGEGTQSWLYVVEHPGDALRQHGRILGPRHLSGRPVELRWPALSWRRDG